MAHVVLNGGPDLILLLERPARSLHENWGTRVRIMLYAVNG